MKYACFYATIVLLLFGCVEKAQPIESEQYEDYDAACDVSFSVSMGVSREIPTVAIVEWTTSMPRIDSAYIEFGRENDYGLTAPVDLADKNFRTLLLGMKPRSDYHFRIVALSGENTCQSQPHVLTTGAQPTALNAVKTEIFPGAAPHGGYTVSSMIKTPHAFIIDADGDYVWWYKAPINTISRARMSADGRHMLIGNLNLKNAGIGAIVKVSMDGLDHQVFDLPNRHHDFTVLPEDNTIAYIEYEQDGVGTCDRLMELAPNGDKRIVYTIRDDFGHRATDGEWCHTNAVNFVPAEGAYYLSVLNLNAILKIDRASGELLWVLGGPDSTFEGTSWTHQHQHQLLDNGNILLFSNGEGGFSSGAGSLALEYTLDSTIATESWRYDGGATSSTLGDVQRLGNGNTVVTYSNAGLIHEVDTETQSLVLSYTWPNNIVAYTIRRDSLYGPPQAYLK